MLKEIIEQVVNGSDLTQEQARQALLSVMDGQASEAEVAGFLVALRSKGETIAEISGMAQAMREKSVRVSVDFPVCDTCGTGGDGSGTFNISTAVAIVLAAAGVRVAKHGNRAISSRAGSADVLQALDIRIDLAPEHAEQALEQQGFAFLFAPDYHPAMKHVMPARRALGIRTVFNILGPLTNPAHAARQVIGVFDPVLTEPLAYVLQQLGTQRALVVHGSGLDEIAVHGPTQISELNKGIVRTYMIQPEQFGITRSHSLDDLKGGDAQKNAQRIRDIFAGEQGAGRDAVLLNAAAGLMVNDLAESLEQGVQLSRKIIDSGTAAAKLEALIAYGK